MHNTRTTKELTDYKKAEVWYREGVQLRDEAMKDLYKQ
jgi:hypothetical protein